MERPNQSSGNYSQLQPQIALPPDEPATFLVRYMSLHHLSRDPTALSGNLWGPPDIRPPKSKLVGSRIQRLQVEAPCFVAEIAETFLQVQPEGIFPPWPTSIYCVPNRTDSVSLLTVLAVLLLTPLTLEQLHVEY
jgi:hypothetical protein